jgi:F-type H+-transporting ATPase subunit b
LTLDWSTLVLELINFLVLVWLLKRFLYKPVLDIIARRRAGIEKTLADAKSLNDEALALRAKYEGRVDAWEAERQGHMEELGREIDAERTRRLTELSTQLADEREKAAAAAARQADETRIKLEATARGQGARFASRLLAGVASPDLERRLVETFLADLQALPAERLAALGAAGDERAAKDAVVASAFPLEAELAERVRSALAAALGAGGRVKFAEDASLGAGLRVEIGAWVLGLNLRDELEGFARLSHGG